MTLDEKVAALQRIGARIAALDRDFAELVARLAAMEHGIRSALDDLDDLADTPTDDATGAT